MPPRAASCATPVPLPRSRRRRTCSICATQGDLRERMNAAKPSSSVGRWSPAGWQRWEQSRGGGEGLGKACSAAWAAAGEDAACTCLRCLQVPFPQAQPGPAAPGPPTGVVTQDELPAVALDRDEHSATGEHGAAADQRLHRAWGVDGRGRDGERGGEPARTAHGTRGACRLHRPTQLRAVPCCTTSTALAAPTHTHRRTHRRGSGVVSRPFVEPRGVTLPKSQAYWDTHASEEGRGAGAWQAGRRDTVLCPPTCLHARLLRALPPPNL